VAHSNCQQKLVEIWYTGLRKVSKMNQLLTFLLVVLFVIMLPFNLIVYLIAPKSKVNFSNFFPASLETLYDLLLFFFHGHKLGRFMYQPCVKFLSHTITYVVFILMLIISSIQFSSEEKATKRMLEILPDNLTYNYTAYMENQSLKYRFNVVNLDFPVRRDKPSAMDVFISIWIAGIVLSLFNFTFDYEPTFHINLVLIDLQNRSIVERNQACLQLWHKRLSQLLEQHCEFNYESPLHILVWS
jgi:hypothetical protein